MSRIFIERGRMTRADNLSDEQRALVIAYGGVRTRLDHPGTPSQQQALYDLIGSVGMIINELGGTTTTMTKGAARSAVLTSGTAGRTAA